jgi:hypothetical protein
MNKALLIGLSLILITACKSPYTDPAYKYDTKKITTPYTDWKEDRQAAEQTARKELNFYAQDECRRMSYGWHMKKLEDNGQLNCEESAEGFHCRHSDVTLLCEQLDESARN